MIASEIMVGEHRTGVYAKTSVGRLSREHRGATRARQGRVRNTAMYATLASNYFGGLRAFGERETGTVTVEFILWMPVLLLILAFTADACQLYQVQADMWNVASDTARRMATGELVATTATTGTAQSYAATQLLYPNLPYTYNFVEGSMTSTPPVDDVAEITVPMASASVFGILAVYGSFTGASIDVKVTMRAEQ